MNNENTSTENINEEDVEIIDTLPPVRVNDIVKHPTLGEFQVIGSSQQKAICQSSRGAVYSLAMGTFTSKAFAFLMLPMFSFIAPNRGVTQSQKQYGSCNFLRTRNDWLHRSLKLLGS